MAKAKKKIVNLTKVHFYKKNSAGCWSVSVYIRAQKPRMLRFYSSNSSSFFVKNGKKYEFLNTGFKHLGTLATAYKDKAAGNQAVMDILHYLAYGVHPADPPIKTKELYGQKV